jgi:hypothetical protein
MFNLHIRVTNATNTWFHRYIVTTSTSYFHRFHIRGAITLLSLLLMENNTLPLDCDNLQSSGPKSSLPVHIYLSYRTVIVYLPRQPFYSLLLFPPCPLSVLSSPTSLGGASKSFAFSIYVTNATTRWIHRYIVTRPTSRLP